MSKIPSAGILQSGVQPTKDGFDRSETGRTTDGKAWNPVSGTWTANGTKLTTSTARTSTPRIVVMEPYSDFDMKADLGIGDTMYVRYQDANNWIRVSQYQTYRTQEVFAGYYYDCECATYFYACAPYYQCNEYLSGFRRECTNNYEPGENSRSSLYCSAPGYVDYQSFCTPECGGCCSNFQYGFYCPSPQTGRYDCGYIGGACTKYTGEYCKDVPVYSWQTCSSTCSGWACERCPAYTTQAYYDTYIRLEKFVAGTLTSVSEVKLGDASTSKATWVRVLANGTNFKVYSDKSPSTPHIDTTIADIRFGKGYGFGRVSEGNQDSSSIDNLELKII